MTDPPTARDDRPHSPVAGAFVSLVLVTIAAVGLAAWVAQPYRSPGWSGAVFAMIAGVTIAVTVVLARARAWADPPTRLGAVGLILIAAGSGIWRPRTKIYDTPQAGGGDVIGRLDTLVSTASWF